LESLDGFWNRFPWIRHSWGNLNVESPKMVYGKRRNKESSDS
jgi:hypothetical protein